MPIIGMEIPARGFHRCVPEDLLKHVQRDTRVGQPGRSGAAESVAGEVGAEACDARVPVGGIPDSRRGEHMSSMAAYR